MVNLILVNSIKGERTVCQGMSHKIGVPVNNRLPDFGVNAPMADRDSPVSPWWMLVGYHDVTNQLKYIRQPENTDDFVAP